MAAARRGFALVAGLALLPACVDPDEGSAGIWGFRAASSSGGTSRSRGMRSAPGKGIGTCSSESPRRVLDIERGGDVEDDKP